MEKIDFNKGIFPLKKRKYGEEQPAIRIGPFRIRLPLIHYEWQWTEGFAAMFLGVACLASGVAVTMEVLGIDNFYIALTFGVLNAICYWIPATLGDPVVPGWITPALPLTITYLSAYTIGTERVHAMIALQMLVALIFLIMGVTGLGKKLINIIPTPIKGGIVLGAGISAAMNVINARIPIAPYTIIISIAIAYFFLFSKFFIRVAEKSSFWRKVRNQGIVPAQIFAIVLAPLILKEIPLPDIEWGITPLNFGYVLKNYTVFGIGWPELTLFIKAIPMALTAYIIAFSDFVLASEIVEESTATRPDETVIFDASRSNLVNFIRNGIMALFAPWVPMNGPLWASGLLTITERYKQGYNTMPSFWGGVGTFRTATVIAVMIMPLVTLVKPALTIFFALTMAVQAYACGYIAMKTLTDNTMRGIGLVMAVILSLKGPSYGLIAGIILVVLIQFDRKNVSVKTSEN